MSKTFFHGGVRFTIAKGLIYCLEPLFLDIETSNNHAKEPQDLRTWITSIQVLFKNDYYLFRYPEELIDFLLGLRDRLGLQPSNKFHKRLIIYVHNLSYDISYLLPYINMLPDDNDTYQGIIEDNNKFLSYVRGCFEFRCSYRLSGMSLEKWSKELNVEHVKQVGLYDYNKIIYPDDELTENEKIYDRFDVLSMKECLAKQLSYYGDDLTSIPLTKTGYIRRTLRRSCRNDKYYWKHYFRDTRLNARCYEYCLKSFAGGYTHNNRYWRDVLIEVGKTYEYIPDSGIYIKVDSIKHRDFKSHYPTQQTCSNRFPIGRPQHIYDDSLHYKLTIEDVLGELETFTYFIKMRVTRAALRDSHISMPFMQKSKCYQTSFTKERYDNGRIKEIEGSCIMYVDSLTLSILYDQYDIDYEILDAYKMKNGRLPDCIIEVVDKYFKGKSDKKALVHELTAAYGKLDPRTVEAEFDLMVIKALLNAIYGCTVQQPLKPELQVNDEFEFSIRKMFISEDQVNEGLEKFYSNKNNFLAYQLGCMVTSLARYELYLLISKVIGYERCLYCDTDSIFYISDDETEKRIEAFNAERRQNAHYVELENGKREYYDEFTLEPDCIAFKGLHSKCYGVVTDKGLEITIAGVPARTLIGMNDGQPIYFTREQELSVKDKSKTKNPIDLTDDDFLTPVEGLDNLRDNFTFTTNTGVSAIYIGAEGYKTPRVPQVIYIDGHEIHTAGGCVIRQQETKSVVLDPERKKKKSRDKNIEENYNTDWLK